MTRTSIFAFTLSPLLFLASCGGTSAGDSASATPTPEGGGAADPFSISEHGTFDEPWAAAFAPGTSVLFITEQPGTMKFVDTATGSSGSVSGMPQVDYGGQGGLGDVAFLPGEPSTELSGRTIYLSWAEAGVGNTRGAALGRGELECETSSSCRIEGLKTIWRQQPKVTGRGHFSHRIAFSPDGKYLFLASGERQHGEPAQDFGTNLGKVLRLNPDGTPAAGNPFEGRGGVAREIWSLGHRNLLGLQFDAEGQLWGLEHGPAGGDELNLVIRGTNYGWPVVSEGDHYSGEDIPPHSARPEFAAPAISWNPVIAPGDFLFYRGDTFSAMKGDAIIAGLRAEALIRVDMDGPSPRELARYPMDARIREIVEAPDGVLWILEDGSGGRLLRLSPG